MYKKSSRSSYGEDNMLTVYQQGSRENSRTTNPYCRKVRREGKRSWGQKGSWRHSPGFDVWILRFIIVAYTSVAPPGTWKVTVYPHSHGLPTLCAPFAQGSRLGLRQALAGSPLSKPPPPLPVVTPGSLPPAARGAEKSADRSEFVPVAPEAQAQARNCKANKVEMLDSPPSWQDLRFCRQFVCAALFQGTWLRKCWK